MVRFQWSIVLASFVTLLTANGSWAADEKAADQGATLPRYKLRVGQELNYAHTGKFAFDSGVMHYKNSWQLLVVRVNADGGWRLLVRNGKAHSRTTKSDKDVQNSEKAPRKEKATGDDRVRFSRERFSLAWCDLSPDGRVNDNPTLGYSVELRTVLPQLPAQAGQRAWQSNNEITGRCHEYSLASDKSTPEHIEILDVNKSPEDDIYLTTAQATFTFDEGRGLIDRIENSSTHVYGFDRKDNGATKLTSVENLDADLCVAIATEMDDYFTAKKDYDDLAERAGREPPRVDELLAAAKSKLDDLRKSVKTKIIQDQLDEAIANHEQSAKYAKDQAERLASVLDKPSPAWETTDLNGSTRSIEASRGKVVVLDFWYRGCGWCIRAMPQVKEVAAHYQGRPVEVFGMNTDRDEDDARFVIEKLAFTYPNLKAEGLLEKYGVRGFPTLLIIDQAGVVRDVHVGYSPTLAKSVIASVDKLLASPPVEK